MNMKILIISEYFYPEEKGGGEISAFLLAKEIAKSGIETHVLTSYFEKLKKEETIEKVKIHRTLKTGKNPSSVLSNIKRDLFFERSLLNELKILEDKESFDIIHCMNITSIYAIKLKQKIKKPFVLHVNSPVLFCPKATLMYQDRQECFFECKLCTFLKCYLKSKNLGKFELSPVLKYNLFTFFGIRKKYKNYQKIIKRFDYYFAISTYMKERLLKAGIPQNKIDIIYNEINLNNFQRLKQNKNRIKRILYLGEYSRPKGPHVLIEALKKIKLPYEANFYGEGNLKEYLKKEIKNNKINAKINEKIKYDKLPEIVQMHDIVVIPSLVGEAFGRVALEAIAAGKVVVASDVGGIGDIIKEGKTGFLYNGKNNLVYLINLLLEKKISLDRGVIKKHIKHLKKNNSETVIKIYKRLQNENKKQKQEKN